MQNLTFLALRSAKRQPCAVAHMQPYRVGPIISAGLTDETSIISAGRTDQKSIISAGRTDKKSIVLLATELN